MDSQMRVRRFQSGKGQYMVVGEFAVDAAPCEQVLGHLFTT